MKIFYSALFLVLLHGIAHAQCGDFTLTVDNVQPPSCPNSSDGAITLSAAGAQGTVSYTWSEAGLNSPTIDGLAPGVYSVTATDDAGCEAVETVVLSAAVVADAGEDLSLSCGTDAVTLGGAVFSPVVFAEQGFQTIEFINASSEEVPFNGTPGGIFIGPVRDTAEYVANDNGVSVQFGNLSGQSGSQVYLPIYVGQGFDDMISFQFGISFDTTMLKLVGMVIPTNALPNFAVSPGDPQIWPQGFFLLSWNSPVPSIGHSLPDGHLLALLQFTVTGSSASTTGPDITYQWTGPNDFTSDEPFPQVARSGAYTLRVTDSSRPDCWAEDVVEVNLVNDIVADAGPDVGAECGAGPVTIGGVGNTEVYFSEDINSIAFVESGQGPIPSNVISGEVGSNPNSPGFDTGSGELFAVIGSATAGVGDTVRLPVRVYNFINISGAAFTINYDTSILELTEIKELATSLPALDLNEFPGSSIGYPGNFLPPGFVTLTWFSTTFNGYSLPTGTSLFTLCFKVKDNPMPASTTGPDITYQWAGPNNFTSTELFPQVSQSGAYTLRVTDTSRPDCWAEDVVEVNLAADVVADAGPDVNAYCGTDTVTIGWEANTEVYFSGDIVRIEAANSNLEVVPFNGVAGEVGSNPNPVGFDSASGELFVEIGSAKAQEGDGVCLPIRVYNFTDIIGVFFTINYNPSHLFFVDAIGFNTNVPGFNEAANVGTPNMGINPGFITVAYFNNDMTGINLPDGSILFTLCFDVLDIPAPNSASSIGPDFTHQWTGPNDFISTEVSPSVTEPGIYTLRVSSISQPDCWAEDEMEVRFLPDSIGVELQDVAPPCLAQPITLRPAISGGTGPYTYQWSDGTTTDSIFLFSSDTAADFTVTVTSTEGCAGVASAQVSPANTPPPVADIFLPQPFLCAGESITLWANGAGGQLPYTYIWRDGPTTFNPNRTISPTTTTTYFLDVIDANGCLSVNGTDSVTVVVYPPPSLDLGPDHYLCTPEQVVLSGPFGAASYDWSNGQISQTIIVQPLQTSTYYLTITNSSGCAATDTVVVHVGLQNLDISSPICDDNGTPTNPGDDTFTFQATIDGSPGGGWFSNFGVTGSYGQTASFGPFSISGGDVTLTVVDGLDPSCNTSVVVQPPAPCSIPISCNITAEVTNFFCSDNGTPGNPADDSLHAFVAVEGGPGSGWNSSHPNGSGAYNSVAELVFAVADGVASLNVFDQDDPGCDTTLLIDAPAFCGLACDVQAVVQEVICSDNGTPADTTDDSFTLEILVTGGLGSGWVEDSSGLSGDYGIPFTFGPYPADYGHVGLIFVDAGDPSCFDIFDLYTPVPCIIDCQQNPIILNFDVVFPTCFGAADGEAIAIVEGGAGGYAYQWSNGATTSANLNLPAGSYSLTVTDILGCQVTGSVTLAEPPLMALQFTTTPAFCPDGSDGSIEIFVTGGIPPYTYFVIGPAGTVPVPAVIMNPPPGTYEITVTDVNGCSVTEIIDYTIGNLLSLDIEVTQQPDCPSSSNGILTAVASGGQGGYEYQWSTGSTGAMLAGLEPGLYIVTVTDDGGCAINLGITLHPRVTADAGPDQTLDCYGLTVALDGSLSATGPTIAYEWTGPNGFLSTQLNPVVSEPGIYTLQVTDTALPGCSAMDMVVVTEDLIPPTLISISPDFVSCDSAVLSYPLFPGMSISWELPGGGAFTGPVLGVTESGAYSFTITDNANGCTAAGQILVDIDPGACATLKGRLVRDTLADCIPDADEPGLANWLIVIQGNGEVYYAVTQPGGYYEQSVPVGDYEVYPLIPGPLWLPCQDRYLVSLQQPGEMAMLDIPVQGQEPCPELTVDFSMPLLRRCWERSLHFNYCNDGTAIAEDAYVVAALDDFFAFQSATAPLLGQDGNEYTFGIGDVAPGQCGSFIVYVKVSCDALVGQTLCAEAKIFPNAPCFPASPNWSGASLRVEGACEGGEVQFRVENIGAGDMPAPRPCIVIEDGVMLLIAPDSIQLNSGEAFAYSFSANGSTYRIEVGQEPFHPGFSMPVAVLEGCGENGQGTFSTGFVNQLALDDLDPFIDIECREVVGSYDPNDKHGFPRGYGDEHFIYPGTDIEYLVQFQNTGNDTAFLVVIRDTLSEYLDITSVQPGAASHPYAWDIDSNNILVFTFEDILLPDSTTNLAGSQGFVEFKVSQQDSLPLGTVIENSAAIYFDINEPIITNTTFHTLGYGFIEAISFIPEAGIPELDISVAPNPMTEWALLQLGGWPGGEGLFELFDLQGRRLREQRFSGAAFRFERRGLPAGLYAFRIVDGQGRWGSGRLVVGQD